MNAIAMARLCAFFSPYHLRVVPRCSRALLDLAAARDSGLDLAQDDLVMRVHQDYQKM